jgi:hypothetical protein
VCGGACCPAGAACCAGGACPNLRNNGAGGTYPSCERAGSYDLASAKEAARSWSASGADASGTTACPIGCFAWQTSTACGVWCYGGFTQGQAAINEINNACLCPPQGTVGNWN